MHYTPFIADVAINSNCKEEMIFKCLTFYITSGCEKIIAGTLDDTIAFNIADGCIIVERFATSIDRKVMIVGKTGLHDFFLPIGACSLVSFRCHSEFLGE